MLFANGKLMIYVLTRGLTSRQRARQISELQAACPSGPAGAPGRAVSASSLSRVYFCCGGLGSFML